jgi:DNA-binding transcriptional ArsR family regulator
VRLATPTRPDRQRRTSVFDLAVENERDAQLGPRAATLKPTLDSSGAPLILKPMLNNDAVDRVFHALAEPTRRAIVQRLSAGPGSVSDLAKPFDMTLAAIGQHLRILEESGVIRTEKVGRVRTCHIEPAALKLAEKWIAERITTWERRLDRLGDLLAEHDAERQPRKRKKK